MDKRCELQDPSGISTRCTTMIHVVCIEIVTYSCFRVNLLAYLRS
jgi:hypothetical protein